MGLRKEGLGALQKRQERKKQSVGVHRVVRGNRGWTARQRTRMNFKKAGGRRKGGRGESKNPLAEEGKRGEKEVAKIKGSGQRVKRKERANGCRATIGETQNPGKPHNTTSG